MKKINMVGGTFEVEIDIDNFTPKKRELTLDDFGGSKVRYNNYVEVMKSLKANEEKTKSLEISENNDSLGKDE